MSFKIDHSLDELEYGHTYTMTAQDVNVLDDEEGAVLEDANL